MTFNTGTGTTPLLARQSKGIYNFLIIPLIFIIVFLAIWFLLKFIKKRHETREWIEAQKKRTTNKKDIKEVAQKYSLTHAESELLWEICKKGKTPNICYLIHDSDAIDDLFRSHYSRMKKEHEPEKKITDLFRLRYKMELEEASAAVITTTTTLAEGTRFTYMIPNGMQILCTLKKNSSDNMIVSIPQQLYDSDSKPPPLSKAVFSFTTHTGMYYIFSTRIIRYSTGLDNQPEMVLSQTNDLRPQTKRQSKRMAMDIPCLFSAVREDDTLKKNNFVPLEKQHECVLLNISADGCCITTPLPIKEHQYICVSIPLGDETHQIIGRIVSTRRNLVNNLFFLHINFLQIDAKTQNRIFASIYGYKPGDEETLSS
jgi:hypothetical protein